VEPNLPNRVQAYGWSVAYTLFVAVCAVTTWRSAARATVLSTGGAPDVADDPAPTWSLRALWLALAASASVLLLAVTTHLTQDVAAIPFLWILPLSLYLLSFIICFEAPRLYRRAAFLPLLAVSLAFMAVRLWPGLRDVEAPWLQWLAHMGSRVTIAAFAGALFICCMVCHGELARLKPHPRRLTGFYVTVSLGGAVGGLFVGLVAPNLFHAYYEFPIGLALCLLAVTLVLGRSLAGAPMPRRLAGMAALTVVLAAYCWWLASSMRSMVRDYRVVARNFYGQLRVYDNGDPRLDESSARILVHGVINHGQQMLRDEYRRQPVTYFCPDSGIGRAMRALEGQPRRIGILGLGCGTLAAYGRAGDTIRIYEINPQVIDIARREFTYLSDTPARVETAIGDGRLVIESEPANHEFDILVMDAFSGDSVPVHLITREAFRSYFGHLKPGGILAVNISNKYLDMEPVMQRAAESLGKTGFVYHYTPEDDDILCFSCSWALVMDDAAARAHPELVQHASNTLRPSRPFRVWTDDFSNMYSVLK
jgi:hypothetical protein